MPAEVESMFYREGLVPWHGLGKPIPEDAIVCGADAIKYAGLNWTVSKRPIVAERRDGKWQEVPEHMAIVRDDTETVLGVVGKKFKPIQNEDLFSVLDPVVERGMLRYETAGSLRGGKQVWALGRVQSASVGGDDVLNYYLFLHTAHDGSHKFRAIPTTVRVVCMNTARAALEDGKGEGILVKHTKNAEGKLKEASEVIEEALEQFDLFMEFARAASKRSVRVEEFRKLCELLRPDPKKGNVVRAQRDREILQKLFETGPGANLPTARGTAWGAFNAVTHYATWVRNTRAKNPNERNERRFEAFMLGSGMKLVETAKKYIVTELLAA